MAEYQPPFEVLVTADKLLWHQHHSLLARLSIGVVLVDEPKSALERSARIIEAVRSVDPGEQVEVTAR